MKGTTYCRPDKIVLDPQRTNRVEAGHPKALGARKSVAGAWLGVLPIVASAGVEQDGDEEQIACIIRSWRFRGGMRGWIGEGNDVSTFVF